MSASRNGKASMPDVGQYKLGHTLGEGGCGVVKLATHIPTGEQFAIKVISAENTDHQMLQQEIENHHRLHHKHVVKMHDVIKEDGDTHIVMEVATGGNLADYILRHARLPEERARRIFQQVIAGVEHCHSNNVAHRDLKAENIFLDSNGSVKIGDFGFSAKMSAGELLTEPVGSPHYAAPELYEKGCAYEGPEVDVWSCGVILFALLCSKLPFDEPAMEELIGKIQRGKYSTTRDISTDAKDLIAKMICVDPRQRISIAQIREHAWFSQDMPPDVSFASKLQEVPRLDSRNVTGPNTHGENSTSQTEAGSAEFERNSAVLIASLLDWVGSGPATGLAAFADGVRSKFLWNHTGHQCLPLLPCLQLLFA